MQQTLVLIKPDGVQRGLIGPILSRFESRGLKIVGLKLMEVPQALAEKHYAEHDGKPFYPGLIKYIMSGPVVAMVLEGSDNTIVAVRKTVGVTKAFEAEPGSIRGDYALEVGRNLVHASDAPESGQREVALWFTRDELSSWSRDTDRWIFE